MVVASRCNRALGPGPRPPELAAHPSEEELLACFLRPRVDSGASPCAFIHEADVYSDDPAELTAGFAPAVASNGDAAWYFFSAVRAKTRDGQRKARTVESGEGCWHSEAGAKPVVNEAGRCLGHRQSFSFVTKPDGRRVRSGWLMVELGLDDADDMALCKVYFSPRARPARVSAYSSAASPGRKRKAAADDESPAPACQRLQHARPTEAGAPHDDVRATEAAAPNDDARPIEAGAPHDDVRSTEASAPHGDVRPTQAGAPHDDGLPTEAGAPHDDALPAEASAPHDDDSVTADAEEDKSSRDDGGLAVDDESSAAVGAEEFWTAGTFFSWWVRKRDRLIEEHAVGVGSDKEIHKTHGLEEILDRLNSDVGDSLVSRPSAPRRIV